MNAHSSSDGISSGFHLTILSRPSCHEPEKQRRRQGSHHNGALDVSRRHHNVVFTAQYHLDESIGDGLGSVAFLRGVVDDTVAGARSGHGVEGKVGGDVTRTEKVAILAELGWM